MTIEELHNSKVDSEETESVVDLPQVKTAAKKIRRNWRQL